MPERARVTSLEAIETFRATLIVYREKAGRVLDEVNDSVVRTRLWLQTNRVAHWKNEVRRCDRELKQRQHKTVDHFRRSVCRFPIERREPCAGGYKHD